jgi:glycosyltransferase involved in cell wall biosynthesis
MAAWGVSACVPVLNGARFLAEALEAIVSQTRPPDEVLVVDGGSTDDSVAIALRFGVQVVTQQGKGVASGFTTAVRASDFPLIAFCAADDVWAPAKLELQLRDLDEHPAVACSHTYFTYLVEDDFQPPPAFDRSLLGRALPGPILETLVARREVFDLVGEFDPRRGSAHDVDWFARARDLGVEFSMVAMPLVAKRLHGTNLSNVDDTNQRELFEALRQSVRRKQA